MLGLLLTSSKDTNLGRGGREGDREEMGRSISHVVGKWKRLSLFLPPSLPLSPLTHSCSSLASMITMPHSVPSLKCSVYVLPIDRPAAVESGVTYGREEGREGKGVH